MENKYYIFARYTKAELARIGAYSSAALAGGAIAAVDDCDSSNNEIWWDGHNAIVRSYQDAAIVTFDPDTAVDLDVYHRVHGYCNGIMGVHDSVVRLADGSLLMLGFGQWECVYHPSRVASVLCRS